MNNKALDLFYRDALRLGNIKCFTHFQPYIKGREELVLTIYTNGADPQEKPRIWQMLTKGEQKSEQVCAPASPPPAGATEPGVIVYLLGAYAKYGWPHAWLRSLPKQHAATTDLDAPIPLRASRDWKDKGLRVWHFVAELLQASLSQRAANPFEINFQLLAEMPPLEQALQAGAAAAFFRDLLLCRDCPCEQLIARDLQRCMDVHFKNLHVLVPPHEEQQQQHRQKGQQQQAQQQTEQHTQQLHGKSTGSRAEVAQITAQCY